MSTHYTADRDALILSALPLVKWQATRMGALPPGVTADDLEGAGHDALMEAATLYDPAGGISFATFARRAVKGRMQDAIRAARRRSRRTVPLATYTDDGRLVPRADKSADDPGDAAAARETAGRLVRGRTMQDVAATLPPPDVVAAKVKALRAALFSGLTAEDAREVMGAVVDRAKLGDLKAAKLFLDVLGSGPEVVVHDRRKVVINNSPPPAGE